MSTKGHTLVREVVETDYSGNHSVRRLEYINVTITWPDEKPQTSPHEIVGAWQLLSEAKTGA